MTRQLSPGRERAVRLVFGARRAWYRVRYPHLSIGRDAVLIGRLKIRRGTRVELGDRVRIRKSVSITGGGVVRVGSDTLLNGCWIIAAERVDIGDLCLVSDCGITDNDFHNLPPELRHQPATDQARSPVRVGDNVWIGLRSLILKGVDIGDDSVVGAGAVVRDDVPAACVVAGNPAQVVKRFGGPS